MNKIEFDSIYEEAKDLLDKVRKINRKQTNSCFSEFDTTFLRLEQLLEKVEERTKPNISIWRY